jgi:Tol biopolymer transport system component
MALSAGDRLGPYEIIDLIGAGGMGEVYRARDTRLNRTIAIKVSLAEFSERAEREARAVAALNHPNICTLHDVGPSWLVMEYIEGPTLDALIEAGPLSVAAAMPLIRNLLEGLEAAHEKGIVHRDLKPGNVKITNEGVLKILDFGLAKAFDQRVASPTSSISETITADGTLAGNIVGTPPYMSPEQARGALVDKRTDIWAFGCILYEMFTSRRAFPGDTTADTLAAVLNREPDWAALPASLPSHIVTLIQRCLSKDARLRLRDIGDARFELDRLVSEASPLAARRNRRQLLLAWGVASAFLATLILMSMVRRDVSPPAKVSRMSIVLPSALKLASGDGVLPLAVSSDGYRVAFVADVEGTSQLYIRDLNSLDVRAIPGTQAAEHPFFSSDGQWVAFFAAGTLQKVALSGGAPLRICNVPEKSVGGSWSGNTIVFALRAAGLFKVESTGGQPRAIAGGERAQWPQILPGEKTVLFTGRGVPEIFTIPLEGGTRRALAHGTASQLAGPAVLGSGGIVQVRYLPPGYLIYGQSRGMVRALAFDLQSQTVAGSPVPVVDSLEQAAASGGIYFDVSATGLLVYVTSGDRHQLVRVDRNGAATPITPDRAAFRHPRISPDGKRIAVAINDETRRSDIWIYDVERGTRRRLTTEAHNLEPAWTPDSIRLAFNGGPVGMLEVRADGAGVRETLLPPGMARYPNSWSPDGRSLVFHSPRAEGGNLLWILPRGDSPRPLLTGTEDGGFSRISPDGNWLAYSSADSGVSQVRVAHFPDMLGKTIVGEGAFPIWSRDGRRLYYRRGDSLVAVDVSTGREFYAGKPHTLFAGDYSGASRDSQFDVAPDGSFIMVKSDESSLLRQLTVVQNWSEELRSRLPVKD